MSPPRWLSCRMIVLLILLSLLLSLLYLSVDFLPPLHHAIVYNFLFKSLSPFALSKPGLVLIGPVSSLYLIPSTVQTTSFGLSDVKGDHGPIWSRSTTGLPVVITASMQWRYNASNLPQLFPDVETPKPTEDAPRLYHPAVQLIRHFAISSIYTTATNYRTHQFFTDKTEITKDMLHALRTSLQGYVHVDGLQLLRVDVPQQFEEAMMSSALQKLLIRKAQKYKSAMEVSFRTVRLAAAYSAVATVKRANGTAGAKLQRGMQNAAKTRLSVAAEMAAFANVTTTRVTPHAVLDYAYWQLVIGEASTRTMPPLHDLLLKAR